MERLQEVSRDREDARHQRLLEYECRIEKRRQLWKEQKREKEEVLRREREVRFRNWDDWRMEMEFLQQQQLLQLFLQGLGRLGQQGDLGTGESLDSSTVTLENDTVE